MPILIRILILLCLAAPVSGQPVIRRVSPARNSNTAPRNAEVSVKFSKSMLRADAVAASVQVFSDQHGGKMYGQNRGTATVQDSTISFNPAQDFMPGERVFVTTTTKAQSTDSIQLTIGHVHEFRTSVGGGGRGSFTPRKSYPAAHRPFWVVSGDVDADGDLDLVTASAEDQDLSIAFNDGIGNFTQSITTQIGYSSSIHHIIDIDEDGDLDLALCQIGRNAIGTLYNDGRGGFQSGPDIALSDIPTFAAFGDLDADGHLDVVATTLNMNKIYIRFQGDSGLYGDSLVIAVSNMPSNIALSDLDSDGDLDVLAGFSSPNRLTAFLNDGHRQFPTSLSIATLSSPLFISAGDVNGDNKIDILSGGNRGLLITLLNDGASHFNQGQTIDSYKAGKPHFLTDLDADGDLDLMISVYIYMNDGSGNFTSPGYINPGDDTYGVNWGDFDGDGDIDLTAVTPYKDSVSVFFNQSPLTATSSHLNTPTLVTVPNPAVAAFRLQNLEKPTTVDLLDATGRKVRSFNAVPGQDISLEGLAQGLYRWRCQAQSGNLIVQ